MLRRVVRQCPHCGARHREGARRCPATGRPIGGDPELVGRQIAGRYHLVRLLGDGGMGAVYKAADQVLRRFVAIKLLHPAVAENPASVQRFEREARAAAAIGHPNIIEILDFGREGHRPYMVMEYLRGRSLAQVLAMERRLTIKRAATIAIHTLAGLAAAHDRGILHRDLKPANLMLVVRFGDRNFVKVCDFGFAALLADESRDSAKVLTPERTLVGTPAYAAPERLRGDVRRDPRLDVYSVGVVLYEMLAGRRPFDAPTFRELARKVRTEAPPPLRTHRPDVPPELERIVMKALANDRDARWPSAAAFGEALLPFGGLQIPFRDEMPSDSFTMEMMRIKAREERLREAHPSIAIIEPGREHDQTLRMSRDEALERVRELSRLAAERERQQARELRANASPLEIPIEVEPPVSSERPVMVTRSRCSGRMVLAVLRFVAQRFGERALKQVLDSMPLEARRPFIEGIAQESWVDLGAVCTLMEHIDAHLGQDDMHLVLEAGRAVADGAFEGVASLGPAGAPPELVVAEMPALLERLMRGVQGVVRRVGRGYGRIELLETDDPSLTVAVSMLGLLARNLERFGAEDVEVTLLSARALDDPETLIDLSWLA